MHWPSWLNVQSRCTLSQNPINVAPCFLRTESGWPTIPMSLALLKFICSRSPQRVPNTGLRNRGEIHPSGRWTDANCSMSITMASSDVGDVSWVVPTVGFGTATWVPGTAAPGRLLQQVEWALA